MAVVMAIVLAGMVMMMVWPVLMCVIALVGFAACLRCVGVVVLMVVVVVMRRGGLCRLRCDGRRSHEDR
jgi:hypothetical protein